MSIYIFAGPTISAAEAGRELKAIYLPPAREGDVYRAALETPRAIGIIDGYFQSIPAVRHKEILWAMSHGIHVFGSASMGALRAAELAPFGMEGIGAIFQLYLKGGLEDDDEVAVVHGPAHFGYPAGSEAMVNIRQTLTEGQRHGVISEKMRVELEAIGKGLFYPDRNYSLILHIARDRRLSENELKRFEKWLPGNRVDQKKRDAVAMLRAMRVRLRHGLKPKKVSYNFEYTIMWEEASQQSGKLRLISSVSSPVVDREALLDELRLKGTAYGRHYQLAQKRFLALRETDRLRIVVKSTARKKTEFRRQHRLTNGATFARWIRENDLTRSEFEALMSEEVRIEWLQNRARSRSVNLIPHQLRLSGQYRALVARATAKKQLLDRMGSNNVSLKGIGLTASKLWRWHFEKVLKTPVPKNIATYAWNLGYTSVNAFRRSLQKEYLYLRFKNCRGKASGSPFPG